MNIQKMVMHVQTKQVLMKMPKRLKVNEMEPPKEKLETHSAIQSPKGKAKGKPKEMAKEQAKEKGAKGGRGHGNQGHGTGPGATKGTTGKGHGKNKQRKSDKRKLEHSRLWHRCYKEKLQEGRSKEEAKMAAKEHARRQLACLKL